jgi:branched-chain amino acid transport system ATP-binding protein
MMLQIKNLKVHYGRAEVLKDISINVADGEIVTLIGANGSGKTTTLRTISGLKKPTTGEIWFEGKRIDGMAAHSIVKLGIAHIPEGRVVFAPMTVSDNLALGAFLRRDRKEIVKDLDSIYKHFPILKSRRNQFAGSMSGGEQQMLAVGRALMSRPKLLLMDEPSMGLSPILLEEVANIIKDINRQGISIVLVEQNARMALDLTNRAYIMEIGSITLEGTANELANNEGVKRAYLGG